VKLKVETQVMRCSCGTILAIVNGLNEAVGREEASKWPCPTCAVTKRLNAFMRAQGYRDDHSHGPGACKHQDALEAGPDVPRRYGSFKSVHCLSCDSFRLTDHYGESMSHWMGREAFGDGLKDDDVE
jgi:hypothetical protein